LLCSVVLCCVLLCSGVLRCLRKFASAYSVILETCA
jgi:hypothetical protein